MTKLLGVQPLKDVKDIQKVNDYLKKNNYKAYVLWQTGLNTGLRIIDILSLNVGAVYHKDYLNIIEQKTQKVKRFPIIDTLKELFNDYCEGRELDEPLFTAERSNKRMNRKNAWRYITDGCKKVGISERVGTHTMRKTFGYHHYQQFHDAVILQKIFNHSSQRITLIYIGVEQDEIDASYNSFTYQFKQKNITGKAKQRKKISKKENNIVSMIQNYIDSGYTKHREFCELLLTAANGD